MARELASSLRSCVAGEKPDVAVKIGLSMMADRGGCIASRA
jgi:hypothetical protein